MSFFIPFDFHKGDCLDGMTIITPIVRGGHGDLYLVNEAVEQKKVLKVIQKADNEGELTGIEKSLAVSSHIPGLVPVLKVGRLPDGRIWCVMPPADNLAAWPDYEPDTLANRIRRDGRLSPDAVLNIAEKILATVRDLHEAGLAHCDVKPENILFFDGEPKLTDYSLLSDLRERPAGGPVGTIGFVPPEMSENPAYYNPQASDLYAIGKIVFCAWSGTDAALFPSVPREIPLREIGVMLPLYMKACSASPNGRFKSAEEFLSAVADARARLNHNLCLLRRGRRFLARYGWILCLALLLALGTTVLMNTVFFSGGRSGGAAGEENGPLVVTTVSDAADANDKANSLREALTYARGRGIQTVSFNMPDGDTISLNDPLLVTHDIRFKSVNRATGNPVTIVLDHLDFSEKTVSTPEGWDGGGAVLCANGGNFVVKGGRFATNRDYGTGGVGGALRLSNGTLSIDGATFRQNAAYSAGGAVSVKNASLTITGCRFDGNYTVGFGGAVDLDGSSARIVDSAFVFNNTRSNPYYHWMGGAIQVNGSDLVFEVTEGKTITCAGNESGFGGFIAMRGAGGKATAEFRIDGSLYIGGMKGEAFDSFCSLYDETDNPPGVEKNVYIRKTGRGIMTVNAPVSDYDERWIVEDGVLAFVYPGGGDFDGEITVSGGQLRLERAYKFRKLTFRLGKQPNGTAYVRGLSNLPGGEFCLDAGGAANGTYLLADGADGFVGTVTLLDASGKPAGILSAGQTLNVSGSGYTLNLEDGLLSLTVGPAR